MRQQPPQAGDGRGIAGLGPLLQHAPGLQAGGVVAQFGGPLQAVGMGLALAQPGVPACRHGVFAAVPGSARERGIVGWQLLGRLGQVLEHLAQAARGPAPIRRVLRVLHGLAAPAQGWGGVPVRGGIVV
ncbi:MAG TPA: hypothetical protein VFL86_12360, partial [Burkholderiaceae bacterium]|nr:hypothetical protein [Burkholderiaceae bacterium]